MSDKGSFDGRVLALDPGERRVGVAVSNSERSMAFPRPALERTDDLVDVIVGMIHEEEIRTVVVGLPLHLNGSEGSSALHSRGLVDELMQRVESDAISVVLHDERLTTVSAKQSLTAAGKSSREHRSSIDSVAATVLLESWMACQ